MCDSETEFLETFPDVEKILETAVVSNKTKIMVINNSIKNYENERERLKERIMQISKQMAKVYARYKAIDIMQDAAYLALKDLGVHEPLRLPRDINGDCGLPVRNAEDGQGLPQEVPGQQPGAAGEPAENAGELHRGDAGDAEEPGARDGADVPAQTDGAGA
jgi:hypothetical protein